ncbi:hypothetical protein [Streptomyces sp. CB01881]|uniref:hypothetical protein n=1 Tax=Streptomyces sp. CB01881 TaxID=2078691 RepID=UPI00129C4EC5|nr:hypothetical protein [Streptomyces sp. CB01881]
MFGIGKKQSAQPQSRQQRRAKAVRKADRAGHAAIDALPTSRSITAWRYLPGASRSSS